MSSEFSPAAVIVHPSGTNNVGYESAFPLWVTGSTTTFPVVQSVTGTLTVNQGLSASNSNAWPVLIVSGGNVPVVTNTTAVAAAQGLVTRNIPQGTQTVAGSGNFNVVGPGAAGAATSGNPVRVGASDGANTRNILSDLGGRLRVVGPYPTGSLFTGSAISPVIAGGVDQAGIVRALRTDTAGALSISVSSSLPVVITGTLNTNVTNQVTITTTGSLPVTVSGVQTVTGTVEISTPVTVQGSVTSVITGTVQTAVTNFPAIQTITGTVSLSPQPITVQGTVTSVITGTVQTSVQSLPNITGSVNVTNSIFPVTGTVLALPTGTQTIAGTVTSVITGTVQTSVTNFPAVQTITGSVGISGIPVITGSIAVVNFPATQTVQGGVSVGNLVSVSGSVNVTNSIFPVTGTVLALPTGTQTVAGTVTAVITGTVQTAVTNFPAVQTITGTVALSPQPITVQGTVTSIITGTVNTNVQTMPNITGSVNVTNSLFNITGSVAVNNIVRVTGSLAVDNVVRITTTGSLPVTAQISLSGSSISNSNPLPVTQASSAFATFTIMALNVTIGNNKSLLSIHNATPGLKIKLREFYIRNPRTTALTGIAGDFRIYRFNSSAPAGGTSLTAVTHDTDDTIDSGVTCKTGATITGEETNPLDRIVMSTDEWGPGTLDQEGAQQNIANYLPARAKRDPQLKAFTINNGQGIHMKHTVNSTAGEMDIIMVFTQETS